MMSGRRSSLDIPMWTRPSVAPKQANDTDLPIPMWVKPSCVHNMEDYVSVVPLHEAVAGRYNLAQRDLCSCSSSQESTSSASTFADDSSDESDFGDDGIMTAEAVAATTVDSTPDLSRAGDDGIMTAEAMAASVVDSTPDLSRADLLVAALRDARIRATARRLALFAAALAADDES